MKTIYDYKNLQELDKIEIKDELETGIIVTATSALTKALSEYYPQYLVVDIHDIINELIPEWEENTKDLHNYIVLRNAIENYAASNNLNRNIYLSIQRNATDIWNAILLLMEADVYPQDIPDNVSAPIKHFKNIWIQLEKENSILMNLRAQFLYQLTDKEAVLGKIESLLKRSVNTKNEAIKRKRFYLIGFYFITPIQARILDIIEKAGIRTAFLNCHDHNNPFLGEIWEKTFQEEYSLNKFKDIQPNIVNFFDNILDNNNNLERVEIIKYSSNLEFAESIKTPLLSDAEIYTPEFKKCEKILKDYFPDSFNRKHLLSYPVGQYIYNLHMMWNDINVRLELKFDYVYKCFSSGWLETKSINGKDYLFELKEIEVYFKDCVTFDDWRNRFQILKEAKECISIFEASELNNRRWHELLGNPFRSLSIYNVDTTKLNEIELLLTKLMDQAEYLFKIQGKTSIKNHFKKVIQIIKEQLNTHSNSVNDFAIAEEMIRNLAAEATRDIECPLNAVKDAVVLLIGGHFDEVDSLEQETATSIKDRIVPLTNIESSVLTSQEKDVYLVLADEFTLPGKAKELPWPLTDELIDSLEIDQRDDTRRYVDFMRSIITNRPLSYRYLFSIFMSLLKNERHSNLHISWIEHQDSKNVDVSPYVLLFDPERKSITSRMAIVDFEKEISDVTIDYNEIEITKPDFLIVPEEVEMDFSLCKYRYLYSYLLNYLPEYKSDFHYSFLLTSLIKAFSIETGKNKTKIAKELFQLFPFFRNIELHQSADYVGKAQTLLPLVFDGAQYPGSRLLIHYLKMDIKELAEQSVEGDVEFKEKDHIKKCRFCPYTSVCIYSILTNGGTL